MAGIGNTFSWEKRLVEATFSGIRWRFQEAEVYVNGRLAGSHAGGYTGFSIDFTPYAMEGDNVIAVRVNNLWQATLAPRGGEHVFSGGIYRNVRLVKNIRFIWIGTVRLLLLRRWRRMQVNRRQ